MGIGERAMTKERPERIGERRNGMGTTEMTLVRRERKH